MISSKQGCNLNKNMKSIRKLGSDLDKTLKITFN